jgi:hypothetical protein
LFVDEYNNRFCLSKEKLNTCRQFYIYQQNNLFVYIHIGFMVYVEEKVRKCAVRYYDGKDKYLHSTGLKHVEYIYF